MGSEGQQTDLWTSPTEELQEFPANFTINIFQLQLKLMVHVIYYKINNNNTKKTLNGNKLSASRWNLKKQCKFVMPF